ncbi:MAG TPA: ABC transporter ATP-binding protein [Polyangia bacterium]
MSDRILRLCNVGKTFGRHRALADVSLTFSPGRVAAVLGPNGAGKSTLLSLLSTLSHPTHGRISLGDQEYSRGSPLRATIGYVGHEPGVYGDLSARQNLRLFASLYGIAEPERRIDDMLTRVGLDHVRREAASRTFSRGMLQRLALARALLHQPEILLFDEPSSALDPTGAAWLTTELQRERDAGRLVVLVTHDLAAAAAVATHLVVLRRGRLAFDETREAFSAEQVRTIYEETTRGKS